MPSDQSAASASLKSWFQRQRAWDSFGVARGGRHETSPSQILASGLGCCGASGRVANRQGTSLSDAVGAPDRTVPSGRCGRFVLASYCSTVVGAAWPNGHYREPSGRGWQDGYTLLLMTSTNAINQTLYDKLNFDITRDIIPVASINRGIGVLEVHPSFHAKTVPEFIAYVKANPGQVNMASGGIGSSQHIHGELFKMMAGVNMVHVPYRGGGPALTD